MKNRNNNVSLIETLEARQMMAADPLALAVSTVSYNGGSQLIINGTSNNDNITINQGKKGVVIANGKWNTTLNGSFKSIIIKAGKGNDKVTVNANINTNIFGGTGNDTLVGGSANDKIYGEGGMDIVNGAAGDDIIISIGDATNDSSTGGKGFDAFWSDSAVTEKITDATKDEIVGGNIHRVTNFTSFAATTKKGVRSTQVSTNLNGENLADPTADTGTIYKNFSTNALFGDNGPTADDISQGYVGDCWYLSTLASIVRTNANAIKQSVVALGDGTFAVQFANNDGSKAFVRVDGDLATASWGGMQYAALGNQSSVWVAIMEKAYATFRNAGTASYASLDGGWMDEAFNDLGFNQTSMIWDATTGEQLLNNIEGELKAGKAVTLAIYEAKNGAPVVGCHAYTVAAVETDANGVKTLVLRNPWGIDGAGNDGNNDGYVRLTATQAINSFWAVISANVK